ncbi:aspartyl/asparaginyl beta-hydroxylase isoform X9 [Drosophila ficusphila]|uniref:aspartyl/asparaginyl beta-hydroxylase isoform X9 n=1 Tax=Drosophila ficusphila TaxID=30025 RepID=UPI0007E5CE33|nr:aspartyl/asparaginyl beta-hydroxylase isoform X9 [Drosophila ficusphila]
MSGDVQPRKRKDKRRKRDDDESSHGVHITKMGNEDLHLHVHHDHGTGGHWCAKIIFFALMAVLLGLVGLIIMENRGLEDLDTPLSESRFSKVFDGWVDEHRDEHEGHDVQEPSGEALDDHDDHDEHDDDEHDEHDEEEEEEPLTEELEEEEEELEEEEEPEAEQEEEDEDEENNAGENITAEDAEEDEDEDKEEEGTVEATVEATTEATAEYEAEDEEEDEPAADDDAVESTEAPPSEADEQEEEDEDEEEQEVEESVEPPRSQSAAQSAPARDDNDDDDEQEPDNNDADDEEDDDFESLDQQFENDPEELQPKEAVDSQEKEQNQDGEEEPKEEGSSWLASLAVKFGVGVALALVSRLVLIRKSPNTNEDEPAPETIMRRRLTIATAEDHIPDDVEELPLLDDEYSEEEIEIEEEIEVEISDIEEEEEQTRHDSDDNVASMASYVPETFEQLSSMYKFAKEPPAKETKTEEKKEKEKEREQEKEPEQSAGASGIYVEYEDGAMDDYEHEVDSDEEITDEEDEISDVDDADLMSRLEAKYGRLPVKEFESDPDSDDPSWTQIKPKEAAPAEKVDPFEEELRKANEEMIRENYAQALRSFNTLTTQFAHEPLAHLGKARALELLAKKERSNKRLLDAIEAHKRYLAFGELVASDQEFKSAGESCIENLRFLGLHNQATTIHELLIERFPKEPRLRNQLSLTYLMVNNLQQVEKVAAETLKLWPTNAVAQLHYGLAMKQLHGDYQKALPYLKYAVESQEEGTQEAFFYLSLGETLQRLSRQSDALDVYRKGVEKGYFESLYQRSLYNEPKLKGHPFWQPKETGYERQLEKLQLNWRAIRDEGLALLGRSGFFKDEAELLRDKGVWQQYELYAQGRPVKDNCQRTPITCSLLQTFPESAGCRRGQVKFSVMQAKTHVWPHCGPTNCRLRAHLTLVAPEPEKTSLRVAEQERTWREGELFIFDDSFEHEVWHNGTLPRLVLIVDMWHPQLTAAQRRNLSPI